FEGFIKGFSWHNDFSSFPLNFVSTLLYQVHPQKLDSTSNFWGAVQSSAFLIVSPMVGVHLVPLW
ncbi:hypothetical protein, partial [Streptococcus dysgalactiae]